MAYGTYLSMAKVTADAKHNDTDSPSPLRLFLASYDILISVIISSTKMTLEKEVLTCQRKNI